MDSEKANVVYEVEEPVAVVRLNRPEKLNAFTLEMVQEIRAAVKRAADDERVAGIVITGTGRGFCAGLDTAALARIAEASSLPSGPVDTRPGEPPALFGYLLRVPKPTIAAVNGVAAGGGFLLAMMCDLRFAAEDASFTTAFSKRGLIAENGISWVLPRLLGTGRALDLLWSARRIDAQEAYRIGFVDRLLTREHLLDEAKAYVRDLAANVSPHSLTVMKAQVYADLSLPFDAACREANRLIREGLEHPDVKEGVASFRENRPPRFARRKSQDNQ
ncbi:MAG: enoyl-CoA hydratase-related protein [Candidatus Binatia bacterium]